MVQMAAYNTAQIFALENAIRENDWFTAIVLMQLNLNVMVTWKS